MDSHNIEVLKARLLNIFVNMVDDDEYEPSDDLDSLKEEFGEIDLDGAVPLFDVHVRLTSSEIKAVREWAKDERDFLPTGVINKLSKAVEAVEHD